MFLNVVLKLGTLVARMRVAYDARPAIVLFLFQNAIEININKKYNSTI